MALILMFILINSYLSKILADEKREKKIKQN